MKNKSFTLIELLVVIVIIGILAGVIMISTSSSINKANFAKAHSFSSTVQNEPLLHLVSEWTFDNASNYGEDTWGNNNGTVYGTTPKSEENCVFGKCLSFNGTNTDYISIVENGSLDLSLEISISVWFKTAFDSTTAKTIIGKNMSDSSTAFDIQFRNNEDLLAWANKDLINGCISDRSLNDDIWHHAVYTFKSGEQNLYVDGVLNDTKNYVGTISTNNNNIWIGGEENRDYYWNGLIDDVRIYSAALSSLKTKQEYVSGINALLSKGSISKKEYNKRINAIAYE